MNADATQELRGRTVVVTGASAGIGAVAARRFAERGATVAVVGRSPDKTAAVGGQAHLADYGRLDDVRGLAQELLNRYPRIDVLANNAGGTFASRKVSADGHELTFQVNHLASFLLTSLLLDRLAEAPKGRGWSTPPAWSTALDVSIWTTSTAPAAATATSAPTGPNSPPSCSPRNSPGACRAPA
jgi:NAD(P)-dependent dehydrogenase (short-subunit alcohol dehydrogenase family)